MEIFEEPLYEENVKNLIPLSRGESVVAIQYNIAPGSTSIIKCDPQPYIIVDCLSER